MTITQKGEHPFLRGLPEMRICNNVFFILFLKSFDQTFNLCRLQGILYRFYLGNRLSPFFALPVAPIPLVVFLVLTFQVQSFITFSLCPGCIAMSPPPSFSRNQACNAQGMTALDAQAGTSNYQQKMWKDREGNCLGVLQEDAVSQ